MTQIRYELSESVFVNFHIKDFGEFVVNYHWPMENGGAR